MKTLNLKARLLNETPSIRNIKNPSKIYFMGICGTAMASLALYLKKQSLGISGSDQNIYPPMSLLLQKAKVPVFQYKRSNIIKDIDLIVVGNVISSSHEEIQKARELNIPVISFPEFLQQSLLKAPKKNIVITGTHGKSTGSALMAWLAKQAYQPTDFFVGAVSKNIPHSLQFQGSDYCVIEGDEYDSSFFAKKAKFLFYNPYCALLTGIEFDHGDIYKDLDQIKESFRQFVSLIPKKGFLVASAHNPSLAQVCSHSEAPVFTYGIQQGDFKILNRICKGQEQTFEILCPDKSLVKVSLNLLGEHNALNATGVFILALKLGWPKRKILSALKSFKGLKRRLDFQFDFQGAKIFEDFAHHPTAIKAGLMALKERYPKQRLLALFEPRSFTSRLNHFQKDYVEAFEPADEIFLAKPYDSSKIPPNKRLNTEQLVKDLKQAGKKASFFENFEDIEFALKKSLKKQDIAVLMSSGSFGGLLQKLKP